jgi:group I intron endonuclease
VNNHVSGIYKITNNVNGKCYIGQSINIHKRWSQHKNTTFNFNDPCYNYPLYRAIRKYGIDGFSFEILVECDVDMLNEQEKFYIEQYNSMYPNGYNMVPGGYCAVGTKLSLNDVEEITYLLKNTKMPNKDIAEIFSVGINTIAKINTGKMWHRDIIYPIRQTSHSDIRLSENDIDEIIYLIKNTNRSFIDIGQQFDVKDHCISAINRGRSHKRDDEQYPIRNSKFANKRYYEN